MKNVEGIIDATAIAYYLSYKCLIDKHIEVCDFTSEYFSAYFVPAITTAAFSCELALKNLCAVSNDKSVKSHDLNELLFMLDKSQKNEIVSRTINAYNKKSEILNVADYIDEKNFYELLIFHKNSFTIWRYFYEGNPSVDLDFIEAFMFCLNSVDDEYEEYIFNQLSKKIRNQSQ
ncbi:hypothetical protein [Paenibacillus sp. FSL P2-0136]|uniref:hypothetical protein n=1 Tax=Paenibacillus sp. FSL P2-0136 TaxID=2975317 RepID=UPI0030D7D0D9